MSWKDDLLPASFRGVPFFYRDTSREGGRRLVNNEFPFRDTNDLEDLGRKAGTHRIEGYVIGGDYFADRDALENALNAQGSATLVHPYKGNLTVGCDGFSVKETMEEGGIARFDMVFIEAGTQPSPVSSVDTSAQTLDASDDVGTSVQADFESGFSIQRLAADIIADTEAMIDIFQADIAPLLAQPAATIPTPPTFSSLLGNEEALAAAVYAFFSGYADAVAVSFATPDPSFTSRGAPPVSDPSYGLASFAAWGGDLAPVTGTTFQRQVQAQNQAAFVSLVQSSAVSALARVYANTQFSSANDAQAARDQVTGLIDDKAVSAADAELDESFAAWTMLYQTSSDDLTVRGKQLPNVVSVSFSGPLPSLAVAERLYADAGRADELVSRNAAPHPLFMPRDVEALAN